VPAALLSVFFLASSGCDVSSREGDRYPSRAITFICPWAAGGGTDRVSRFWADELQRELGIPCIVVNRDGGSGAIGHSALALATPDGYTLGMATFELSTMHWMAISKHTYADFEMLLQVNADAAAILVRADAPWSTLGEFLAHVRAHPGTVRMSGTAVGGSWDLARSGLLLAAGIPVTAVVWVPTRGSAPAIVKILGGHIEAVCVSVPEATPSIEAGELKVLAVMSEDRLPEYPELPTAREQGVDWAVVGWRGLALPRGTPREVVALLHETCRKIAASPAYAEFMKKNGFGIKIRGPEEFREFLAAEDRRWEGVIEATGHAAK
jgi:tripartite-type tricarboxylate transporter receptor subunit TctC